jgi:O-antigen/teichoic acid export membrane protein
MDRKIKLGQSLTEKVADSIFWNAILLPVQYILSLLSSVVVTGVLGIEGYGLLASLNSISSTINSYTNMGVAKSLPKFEREVQEEYGIEGWNSLIWTLIVFRLVIVIVVVALLNVFAHRVCDFFDVRVYQRLTVGIVSILLVLQSVSDTLTGVLVAEFKNKAYNLSRVVTSLVTPLATIVVALLGGEVLAILSVGIVTGTVQIVTLWMGARKSIHIFPIRWFPIYREKVFLWRFVRFSAFTYMIILAGYFLSLPFAILMMNFFGLHDRVAYLALGGRLISMVRSLITMPLNYIISPLLGAVFLDKTYTRLRQAYRTMLRIYQLLIVPSSLGVIFMANFIVITLYEAEFANATSVLRILSLTVICSTVFGLSGSILQIYERYRWMSLVILLGIAGSVLGMLVLVPLYSEIGAAIALVVGSIIFYGSSTIICQFEFSLAYPVRFLVKILVSCTPMLIYLPFSAQIERSVPIVIAYMGFVALSFWGIFKLQGGINQEERDFLARVNLPMKGLLLKVLE